MYHFNFKLSGNEFDWVSFDGSNKLYCEALCNVGQFNRLIASVSNCCCCTVARESRFVTTRQFASNYNYKLPTVFYIADERNSIQLKLRRGACISSQKKKSRAWRASVTAISAPHLSPLLRPALPKLALVSQSLPVWDRRVAQQLEASITVKVCGGNENALYLPTIWRKFQGKCWSRSLRTHDLLPRKTMGKGELLLARLGSSCPLGGEGGYDVSPSRPWGMSFAQGRERPWGEWRGKGRDARPTELIATTAHLAYMSSCTLNRFKYSLSNLSIMKQI